MAGLRRSERAELEKMHDQLASAISFFEDQVSMGLMTSEQADYRLSQQFGSKYLETLTDINELLARPSGGARVSQVAMVVLIVGMLFGGAVFTFFPTAVTGLTIKEEHASFSVTQINPLQLEQNKKIFHVEIEAAYSGSDSFILYLQDANDKYILLRGTAERTDCPGCIKRFEPPYLIELKGSGTLNVRDFQYEVARW